MKGKTGKIMKKHIFTALVSLASIVGIIGIETPVAKADNFAKKHPRRAQVVRREKREQNKNNAAAVDGKITDKQAQHLDKEDRNIRKQERADAAANGGHITKGEQKDLNREENSVNRQRNRDERKDAAAAPSSPPAAAPGAPAAGN